MKKPRKPILRIRVESPYTNAHIRRPTLRERRRGRLIKAQGNSLPQKLPRATKASGMRLYLVDFLGIFEKCLLLVCLLHLFLLLLMPHPPSFSPFTVCLTQCFSLFPRMSHLTFSTSLPYFPGRLTYLSPLLLFPLLPFLASNLFPSSFPLKCNNDEIKCKRNELRMLPC